MACRDYPSNDDPRAGSPTVQDRLDQATRLLCELCRTIIARAMYEDLIEPSGELSEWWHIHQEKDRIRLLMEQTRKLEEERKQAVLAKLTPEDRKLLGLK